MDRMNCKIVTKVKIEIEFNKNGQIFRVQKDILIQSCINKIIYNLFY